MKKKIDSRDLFMLNLSFFMLFGILISLLPNYFPEFVSNNYYWSMLLIMGIEIILIKYTKISKYVR